MTTQASHHIFSSSDGVALRFEDSGGTGLPFLFQHGLCGDARQTAEVCSGSIDVRHITMEMRGHGNSSTGDVTSFSIATFADDCAGLITSLELPVPVVGGISMGAAIALRLAVTHPEKVRALVLARPAWLAGPAPPNMQPNAEVGTLINRWPAPGAEAAFMASATAQKLAQSSPDNLASLRSFFSRPNRSTTAELLTRISADGPGVTTEQVKALRIPTLVIATRQDFVHPFALAEELTSLIPAAKLVEIAPKGQDRARYVAEFRSALHIFLKGLAS